MQYSVTLDAPREAVLAGLWNSQPFTAEYLRENSFPAGLDDRELFVAQPSRRFAPEQIVGSIDGHSARVCGKLIVPRLVAVNESKATIVYPAGREPLSHDLMEAIEQPRKVGGILSLLQHQAELFISELSSVDPFGVWALGTSVDNEAGVPRTSREFYAREHNSSLPNYIRYAQFLLSAERVVPKNDQRHVLEHILDLKPIKLNDAGYAAP